MLICALDSPRGSGKNYRRHSAPTISATSRNGPRLKLSGGIACDRNSKSIIHRILKLLLASDVPFRGLHKGVAKEKQNLFQFASTTMAQAGASAAKIVGVPDRLYRPVHVARR
jgi:hypothetical protein